MKEDSPIPALIITVAWYVIFGAIITYNAYKLQQP